MIDKLCEAPRESSSLPLSGQGHGEEVTIFANMVMVILPRTCAGLRGRLNSGSGSTSKNGRFLSCAPGAIATGAEQLQAAAILDLKRTARCNMGL